MLDQYYSFSLPKKKKPQIPFAHVLLLYGNTII